MYDLIQHAPFIYHLALGISLGAVTVLIPRGHLNRPIEAICFGLLFGAVAMVGMMNPIQGGHGLFFDGRTVLVSLSALFFGPWAGIVTAGMTASLRLWIGGNGALIGVANTLMPLLIGVILYQRQKSPRGEWSAWQLLGIGVVVHIGTLLLLFLGLFRISMDQLMDVLKVATLPVLTLYPMATVLLGKVLSVQAAQQRLLRAAQAGEARLYEVLEFAPIAMLLLDASNRVSYLNQRFLATIGYTPDDIPTVDAWMHEAYPDPALRAEASTQWQADVQRARRGDGYLPPKEFMVRTKAGRTLAVEISATVIGEFIVVAFNDVTARREIERDAEFRRRLYAMLSQTNKLITHGADETALFEGICRIAVEDGGFKFAWYGSPREDGQVIPLARFGEDGGYIDALNINIDENDPRGRGPTGQVLRGGSTVVTNDFLAAIYTMPWKDTALRLGVAASGVFPVRRRGVVVGALNFYSGEKDFFTPERVVTLEEIAGDVSFALDTLTTQAERAKAEAAVESLSIRLAHYLETSPVISYALVMEEGLIRTEWVSENIETLLGYTVEEAMGEGWWESHLFAADREDAMSRAQGILKSGEVRHEYRFHRKDGSVLWVLDAMRIEQREDGVVHIFGAWTDITQLKENEESLQLQSTALNATANGIVVTDVAGNIEWVNPAFTTITGYALEEVQGKNPKAVLKSGVHDEAYYKNLWDTILSGQVWRGLLRNRRKDGTLYTEEQTITPIRDASGKVTRFVGVKVDVTERERIATVLRDSQQRLQRALQIGNIALWEWDLDTGDIYYSPEWATQTGDARFGASGALSEWFDRTHPDDLVLLKRDLHEARTSAAHRVHRDFRLRHDDGEYRWIQMNASHEFDEAGKLTRMLGTNVDVTEIKRLESEFEQAQKLESIGRLAGGVAHDFNNLLSVIGGYTEMALAMLEAGTPLHKDLTQVKRASDRAAGLTRQLLAFSRRQLLSPEVLNLNTITADAEKMLRRLIGEDVELRVEPGENLGQVMADPGQIEQVLLNLAVNARDAMPNGGQLTISTANLDLDVPSERLHCRVPPGRYVQMSVCDTGCGMPQEVLTRIFEPFFTTKEQGKGTGLGLPTVYGIVKQSGGYIAVKSRPGEGACFEIFLPRIDAAEAQASDDAKAEIPRGTECILVAEDEEVLRGLAQRFLEPHGYTVHCACSGAEAIDLIAQGKCRPDLLLTDVIMPGMSGPELAERVRLTHPDMKVVYMSGYTDDQLAHHGVLREGTLLVQKPFTARQLTAKVREALDGTKPAPPAPQ